MSKWLMQAHFRHLYFDSFLIIQITPQCEVFWPLQSNSEFSRVPEDSQLPISKVWVATSHSFKLGLWHLFSFKTQLPNIMVIWYLFEQVLKLGLCNNMNQGFAFKVFFNRSSLPLFSRFFSLLFKKRNQPEQYNESKLQQLRTHHCLIIYPILSL